MHKLKIKESLKGKEALEAVNKMVMLTVIEQTEEILKRKRRHALQIVKEQQKKSFEALKKTFTLYDM